MTWLGASFAGGSEWQVADTGFRVFVIAFTPYIHTDVCLGPQPPVLPVLLHFGSVLVRGCGVLPGGGQGLCYWVRKDMRLGACKAGHSFWVWYSLLGVGKGPLLADMSGVVLVLLLHAVPCSWLLMCVVGCVL